MPISNGVNRLLFGALTADNRGMLRRSVQLPPRRDLSRTVTMKNTSIFRNNYDEDDDPNEIDIDDDESKLERRMVRRTRRRLDSPAHAVDPVDCLAKMRHIRINEFRLMYKQATGRNAPKDADRDFFCSKMTATALSGGDPVESELNRKFTQLVKSRNVGNFCKWIAQFPDPFIDQNGSPKSTHTFQKEILESMYYDKKNPELTRLLTLPKQLQNMCTEKPGFGDMAKLNAYQEFIRNYFQVRLPIHKRGNPLGGLLIWHSVGAGKTCSYVAAASSSYEMFGWSIVLGTPMAHATDFLKNVFDTVCHAGFAESLKRSPEEREKFQKMTPMERSTYFRENFGPNKDEGRCGWVSEDPGTERKTEPIQGWTHKRIGNLLCDRSHSSPDVKMLQKCHDRETDDPLFRVLFVIDEAHTFINNYFYKEGEFQHELYNTMIRRIARSRQISKHNGVRFILVTATPQNPHPANLFRLINMMSDRPQLLPVTDTEYANWAEELPVTLEDFTTVWNASTPRGLNPGMRNVYNFFLASRGLISYIDLSDDVSHFPHKTNDVRIMVRLTENQVREIQDCIDEHGVTTTKRRRRSGPRDGSTDDKDDVPLSVCIRHASNFANSDLERYHFDSPMFEPQRLREELPLISEKMVTLLNRIDQLDEEDLSNVPDGQQEWLYKHVIYTRYTKDARMMLSCFLADGEYNSALGRDKRGKLDFLPEVAGHSYNIAVLSGDIEMWGEQQTTKLRKKIAEVFNSQRNAHGRFIRFLIIDQTMQEGIDLRNVRHLHIFEPTRTDVLLKEFVNKNKKVDAWDDTISKQIVGRVSRFCGSKHLEFDDTLHTTDQNGKQVPIGWKLTVDRYYEVFDKRDRRLVKKARSPMELLVQTGAIDMEYLVRLGQQVKVRNMAIVAAVDRGIWYVQGMDTYSQAIRGHKPTDVYVSPTLDGEDVFKKAPEKERTLKPWSDDPVDTADVDEDELEEEEEKMEEEQEMADAGYEF